MKLAIVGSNNHYSENIKLFVEGEDNLDFIGIFSIEKSDVQKLSEEHPDIILFVVNSAETDLAHVINVKRTIDDIKIVILADCENHEYCLKMIHSKINGILNLDTNKEELLYAITKIMDHGFYFNFDALFALIENPNIKSIKDIKLNEDEINVIKHVASGKIDSEIARDLKLKKNEFIKRRNSLFKKVNVINSSDLILFGVQQNILS